VLQTLTVSRVCSVVERCKPAVARQRGSVSAGTTIPVLENKSCNSLVFLCGFWLFRCTSVDFTSWLPGLPRLSVSPDFTFVGRSYNRPPPLYNSGARPKSNFEVARCRVLLHRRVRVTGRRQISNHRDYIGIFTLFLSEISENRSDFKQS